MELAVPKLHEKKLYGVITTATGPNGDFEDRYFQ